MQEIHIEVIGQGACPFKCCTYRHWTANSEVAAKKQQTPADATKMEIRNENAGFSMKRVPVEYLTEKHLAKWLEKVRECWEDMNEC